MHVWNSFLQLFMERNTIPICDSICTRSSSIARFPLFCPCGRRFPGCDRVTLFSPPSAICSAEFLFIIKILRRGTSPSLKEPIEQCSFGIYPFLRQFYFAVSKNARNFLTFECSQIDTIYTNVHNISNTLITLDAERERCAMKRKYLQTVHGKPK